MLSAYMYHEKLLDQNLDKVKIPTEEKGMIWFFKHKDSSYFPIVLRVMYLNATIEAPKQMLNPKITSLDT